MTIRTRAELLADAKRELIMRQNVYRKRVEAGTMKQEVADKQIECQEQLIELLNGLQGDGYVTVVFFHKESDADGFVEYCREPKRADKVIKAGRLSS